ncbi:MAG: hypothetical protein U0930_23060 [Pirellulales bacterium]
MLVLALVLSGCRQQATTNSFGSVTEEARTSLNGLGVHKRMWELAGAKCFSPRSLSFKLEKADTIVMVPQTFDPPGLEARKWLEDWLKRSPGRTLIYFGRDFNAETYYLEELIKSTSGTEKARLEFELANARTSELNNRLDSYSESTFCGWFYLDASQPCVEVTTFEGLLADEVDSSSLHWPVRTRLLPPHEDQITRLPSWLSGKGKLPKVTPPPFIRFKSGKVTTGDDSDKLITRSNWTNDELETKDDWNDQFNQLPDSEMLLASKDGVPLVYRLTSEERFGDGQIIVVANGIPFLNGTLVKPQFSQVGEQIVELAQSPKRVALVAYDDAGIQISNFEEMDARGLGIEMLVQWPLSAITIPACIAGIILCISLLPILGRPQQLPKASTSDFGMHVDALGQMLYDSRDQSFAAKAVAEYYRTVRNEKPPAWIASELQEKINASK